MGIRITRSALIVAMVACSRLAVAPAIAADADPINAPPTAQDWQALAKLPDWSGVWTPVISDQAAQEKSNPPPWQPRIAKQIAHMVAAKYFSSGRRPPSLVSKTMP